MIWIVGTLAFIAYRVFNAGMNSKSLFYSTNSRYNYDSNKKELVQEVNGDKVFAYIAFTVGLGLTWPISLPAVGIYLLGKRYAK